jgi:hypothetical protein
MVRNTRIYTRTIYIPIMETTGQDNTTTFVFGETSQPFIAMKGLTGFTVGTFKTFEVGQNVFVSGPTVAKRERTPPLVDVAPVSANIEDYVTVEEVELLIECARQARDAIAEGNPSLYYSAKRNKIDKSILAGEMVKKIVVHRKQRKATLRLERLKKRAI